MTLLLASYALTFAIRNGKLWFITDHLQRWAFFRNMFACVLCTGTEVGGWLYFFTQASQRFPLHVIESVLFGLSAGAFCLIVEVVLDALTTHSELHHGGDD